MYLLIYSVLAGARDSKVYVLDNKLGLLFKI